MSEQIELDQSLCAELAKLAIRGQEAVRGLTQRLEYIPVRHKLRGEPSFDWAGPRGRSRYSEILEKLDQACRLIANVAVRGSASEEEISRISTCHFEITGAIKDWTKYIVNQLTMKVKSLPIVS